MTESEQPLTLLAFDFGLKHIGVAYGQTLTAAASPVTTLAANNGKAHRREIDALISQWQPNQLVVGLPLNMDGSESTISRGARAFALGLARQNQLPVWLMDERLSSREAIDELGADPQSNHALAAVVIAERYLRDPGHAEAAG